ncbi:MAG: hypothetical protein RSB96_04410, partial [Oscillospiraceae bacterium]
FTFIVYDNDNRQTHLKDVMRMEIRRSLETPSDSLHIVFLYSELVYELFKIKVLYNNQEIFFGNIDRQKIVRSDKGNFLSIEARNPATALIECESLPQLYYNLSLEDAYNIFIRPYGIEKLHTPSNPSVRMFKVEKGTSEWESFCNFCSFSMNSYPTIVGNEIYANNKTPDTHHYITETTDYMEMEYIFNHYDGITMIYMYNPDNGVYQYVLANSQIANKWPPRIRYYTTKKEEIPYKEQIIRKKYRDSLKTLHACRITFHGFRAYKIGDSMSIDDALMKIFNGTILDIKYIIDSNGFFTVTEIGNGKRNIS